MKKQKEIFQLVSGNNLSEAIISAENLLRTRFPLLSERLSENELKKNAIFLAQEYCFKVLHGYHVFECSPMQVANELATIGSMRVDAGTFKPPFGTCFFWFDCGFGYEGCREVLIEQVTFSYVKPTGKRPPVFYLSVLWQQKSKKLEDILANKTDELRFHTERITVDNGQLVFETKDDPSFLYTLENVFLIVIRLCQKITAREKQYIKSESKKNKKKNQGGNKKRPTLGQKRVIKVFEPTVEIKKQSGKPVGTAGYDTPSHYQTYWVKDTPKNIKEKVKHWQKEGRDVVVTARTNERGLVAMWLQKEEVIRTKEKDDPDITVVK